MDQPIYGRPAWLAQTNFWVIRTSVSSRECIIVDIPPEIGPMLDYLAEHDLKPVAIVATHGHIDHVGGIPAVAEQPAYLAPDGGQTLPVYAHPADHHMIADPLGNGGMLRDALVESGVSLRPPELLIGLEDDESVKGAGLVMRALHTPGHTQGSICLATSIEGYPPLLFSGDHLFAGSIGRTDLPGGSYEQLMESMVLKILPLADETLVLPGHGQVTSVGQERLTNPFLANLR